MKDKLNKVVEDINTNVPNAKESAEKLQKQFQDGVQALVTETNKIAETVKQNSGTVKEEVAGFTKKAVDIAVEATQNLNEQLKTAANQAAAAKNWKAHYNDFFCKSEMRSVEMYAWWPRRAPTRDERENDDFNKE